MTSKTPLSRPVARAGKKYSFADAKHAYNSHLFHYFHFVPPLPPGAQLDNFKRGAGINYNSKVEIIHGLSPSVKCVVPLFRDMSLAKVLNAGGGAHL